MAEATKLVGGGVSFPSGLAIRGAHPRISVAGGVTDFESGPLRSVEGTIPTASVLALFGTGFEVVPAQTGKVFQVISLTLILDYAGVAYANGGAVAVYNGAILMSATIAAAFVNGTADAIKVAMGASDVVSAKDSALLIKCATAEFITGTSPLRYKLVYAAHDHGL